MSRTKRFRPFVPRLERRDAVDLAWQAYVEEDREPSGVGAEIARSWRRAREANVDPGMARSGRVLAPDALADRCTRDEVFRLAAPVLAEFARRLELHDAVLAYLDGEGWMLSVDGDPETVEQVREIEFRPGACWTEATTGTNGPGTALAEAKPVEVFASEHFVSAWHPWSCAAAPILAPGEATPLGVVDITAPWEVQRRHAILIAKAVAGAIEERLRAARAVRDEVLRYALQAAREAGDALVAVDARGRVIAANDAAERRRIVDAGALARAARDAVAAALRAPAAGLDAEICLETPEGQPLVASLVRYEGAAVGAILRASPPGPSPRAARPRGPAARYDLCRIQGRSEPLLGAIELARMAAGNELPVVITGESGTGKELFAHAIHAASGRHGGPFVAVNCGALPAQLVESELFGYEPGTFTGARREGSPGRFEDAAGGTLLLDEVSELPPPAQTALLRVLQEREVVRLGGSTPRPVDVRVVAASNRQLEDEIAAGRFRRDLYYRLAVLPIAVPPLRERGDDVVLLAHAFLAEAVAELGREGLCLAPDALQALRAHPWPGNVRELRNVILRAAATSPEVRIGARALGLPLGGARPAPIVRHGDGTLRSKVLESERDVLLGALDAAAWNVALAAERLGVSRMTLYRRLQRHGISRTRGPL